LANFGRISKPSAIRRTTIANLVDRLEQREWLERNPPAEGQKGNGNRFVAAISRRRASMNMAQCDVDTYFDGRATSLVMSLLKSRRPENSHVRQLKLLLEQNRSDQLCRVETEEALRLLLGEDATAQDDRLWCQMQKRYAAMQE
jgi:predicted transcriptional regulator